MVRSLCTPGVSVPEMVVQYFAECRYNKQQSASRLAALLPCGVDPDVIVQSLADKALSD